MKSPYLFVALLLATLFAFQAQSLRLARNQMPLSIDTGNRNYFGRLGFNNLLEKATDSSDPTQTVANVFNYYIDGRDYFNYIQELYCQANTQGGKYITLEQYFAITDAQGVHQVDARRVSEYVRGVFGLVNNDTSTTPIDAFTFNQAAELLFAESVSVVTFSYIVQSSRHSRHVTVTADQVQEALVNIFSKFGDSLPAPNCDEIRYLFHQSDVDKDGELNLQEFHVFLAIYLRFYKYGIQNNRYAVSVMKDQIFEYVWNNEDGLGGRTERSNFLQLAFARFLQMTVYDKIQNQMSHLFFTKFDSDGSGAIDRNEFAALLDFFHAPTDEVDVLFIAADTDGSGQIDFSEFIVTLTTLLRKLTADFGYSLLTMEGAPANVDNAYAIFKDATTFLRLEILSRDTFEATFAAVDEDNNAVLSIEEFTKFLSNIIGQLRAKVRLEEEAQISAVAGLDVDEVTAEDIQSAKEEAAEQVSDIVYSDQTLNTQDAIGQVQDDNGATEEELENAAESQVGGASVEEVIQAAEQIATEQIITAVTEAAIAQATSTDCPTEEAIAQVIEQVLTDGTVDDIISTIENTSGEEIIETVAEVVHEQHPDEYPVEDYFEQLEGGDASQQVGDYVYYDSENNDSDVEAAIDDVISTTGATETEIEAAIESQIGLSSVEDVITAAQQVATEQVIDAVTIAVIEGTEDCTTEEAVQAAIEQVLTDGTIDDIVDTIESSSSTTIIENVIDVVEEGDHTEEVTEQITDETGYTEEELNDAIESQLGGGSTVEDVIEAAETVATEQVIDAVTEAVIAQVSDSSDCPTEESIADAIEDVIEGGVVDDIVEQLQEASTDDIVEAVTDVVEGNDSSSSDSSDSESSDGDSTAAVIEQIEDSGVSVDDIEEALEDQTGGASVEDVIEAANQVAAESVIEAVAEAVIENVPEDECVTPSSIEYAIQDAIDSGVVDQVVEDIDIPAPEDVVEAVEEAASSDESDEESSEESDESSDESSDSSDERPNSAFIQLSGFRQFLGKN